MRVLCLDIEGGHGEVRFGHRGRRGVLQRQREHAPPRQNRLFKTVYRPWLQGAVHSAKDWR